MAPPGITSNLVKAILNIVTGGLSFIGCMWVFHFYFKTITPRPVSMKLILLLSVSDFIFTIANILSIFDENIEGLCDFEAIIRIGSIIAALFWSTCIAVLSYLRLAHGENFQQELFFKRVLITGIVLSVLFAASPMIPGRYRYGPVTFGCYVVVTDSPTQLDTLIAMTIYDGLPVILSLIVTMIFYFLLAKKFKEVTSGLVATKDTKILRLFWYPAVIFLAYIPGYIDNILEIYKVTNGESYVFTAVHITLSHSIGFTNALVYGYQRKRYYEIYEKPQMQKFINNKEANTSSVSQADSSLPESSNGKNNSVDSLKSALACS